MDKLRVKICGITTPEQGKAIAQMGADTLGFICVSASPRFVTPEQIYAIGEMVSPTVSRVGVFANAEVDHIVETVAIACLSSVQLHGDESPEWCELLRSRLPSVELIKALRVRDMETLNEAHRYSDVVDTLLLDAYHPTLLGGTGKTLDWSTLQSFQPKRPWLLAGGLTPDNVLDALGKLNPAGIDLSSGLERSPGNKDLDKVAVLFTRLKLSGYL